MSTILPLLECDEFVEVSLKRYKTESKYEYYKRIEKKLLQLKYVCTVGFGNHPKKSLFSRKCIWVELMIGRIQKEEIEGIKKYIKDNFSNVFVWSVE